MKYGAWTGILFTLALIAMWRLMAARAERAEAEIATLRQQMTEKLSSKAAPGGEVPRRMTLEPPQVMAAAVPPLGQPRDERIAQPARPAASASRATAYADLREYEQASFEAQSVDVNWSRDATRSLRGVFDQIASPTAALKSVDCRQTICRAELTHDSENDSRAFMKQWMYAEARRTWKGPISGGVVGPDSRGTVRTVFFFAREGTDLPAPN